MPGKVTINEPATTGTSQKRMGPHPEGRGQASLSKARTPITVAMPRKVIINEPATCATMPAMAHDHRPPCNNPTISAEKLEKVVSEPRNPVMISKRHVGDSCGQAGKAARAMPMRYAPSRLALNVPRGKGSEGKARVDNTHRKSAPAVAPTLILRICSHIALPCFRNRRLFWV